MLKDKHNLLLVSYLVLALSLGQLNAMYQHQAGKVDWKIRTVGELKQVAFASEKLYFVSKDGVYGAMLKSEE